MALLVLVALPGSIAVTADLSVAVLRISREQTQGAGGVTDFVDSTSSGLWPTRVDLEHYYGPYTGVNERCPDAQKAMPGSTHYVQRETF
jgi:hypothetical protein